MPALLHAEEALWRDCPFCGGEVALIQVDSENVDVAHVAPVCTWFLEYLNSDTDVN
jgi:hypothetical protein